MRKFFLLALIMFPLYIYSHCEIPCGIYDDQARIDELLEDVRTVEKSMAQIRELSGKKAVNKNQLIRWVSNKESHSSHIQKVVTQYFLTQRVKMPKADDAQATAAYEAQLKTIHQIIVYAMKCKQTTDQKNIDKLRALVKQLPVHFKKKTHG